MLFLTLLACKPESSPNEKKNEEEVTETDPGPQPAELAPLSGTCPDFQSSSSTFTSNGIDREIYTYLPADPAGAPVLFFYHPLGGTAPQMAQYLAIKRWVEANNVVAILPSAKSNNMLEWDFWNGLDDDFVMFDDVRTCLVQDLGVDPKRFYISGFSAGALWTSYLSTRRGDSIAAILPFSGGDPGLWEYQTPAYTFPALMAYGGDSDIYQAGPASINFKDGTLTFATELSEDGHSVALCNHNGGHTMPQESMDILTAWMLPQVFGQPSPYDDGLEGFPDWCDIGPEAIDR